MTDTTKPLNIHQPISPLTAFSQYCDEERLRRLNSGESFDSALFDEVVRMVRQRLAIIEEEGLA